MRTILCRQCLAFITTASRDVLGAGRDHVLDDLEHHPFRETVFMDLDGTAQRLICEALGAKARR